MGGVKKFIVFYMAFPLFFSMPFSLLASGWMWHGAFPWIYSHQDQSWLFLKAGRNGNFYQWNQAEGNWFEYIDYTTSWRVVGETQLDLAQWENWESNPSSFGGILTLNKIKKAALSSSHRLDISYHRITDLEPLGQLPNLRELHLQGNEINNLAPLSNLRSLEILDLSSNLIEDVGPLGVLTSLRELNLDDNEITDGNDTIFDQLVDLSRLEKLSIARNDITDTSGIEFLKGLEELNLIDNSIRSVSGLIDLPALQTLDLGGNLLIAFPEFPENNQLKVVYLEDNYLSDINFITALKDLREINLSDNRISSIVPLDQVVDSLIWYADFSINGITELDGIEKLPNLRILSISNNFISSLDPLAHLTELRTLFMDNNEVVSLSPLGYNHKLTGLYASNNKISDPYGLIGLETLVEALLWGNEISEDAKEVLQLARPKTTFSFE